MNLAPGVPSTLFITSFMVIMSDVDALVVPSVSRMLPRMFMRVLSVSTFLGLIVQTIWLHATILFLGIFL